MFSLRHFSPDFSVSLGNALLQEELSPGTSFRCDRFESQAALALFPKTALPSSILQEPPNKKQKVVPSLNVQAGLGRTVWYGQGSFCWSCVQAPAVKQPELIKQPGELGFTLLDA